MDISLVVLLVCSHVAAACLGSLITTTYFRKDQKAKTFKAQVTDVSGTIVTVASGSNSLRTGDEIIVHHRGLSR